jgi:hypothetical protein
MAFESLRRAVGDYLLKKEVASLKRSKTAFNMSQAKSFVILFEAGKLEDIDLIKKYVNYLKGLKKKVHVIGYFSSPFPPDFTYPKLDYEFFSVKELNWYFKPLTSSLGTFLAEEFDVLIDLNFEDHFPLRYMSALSKARFKVGKFSKENQSIFDLLIDIDAKKTFKYLLQQVDIYLEMINKKVA